MKINEIFSSLQGESRFAGYPTTFVRTHGCNMLCDYCDTLYAVVGKQYKRMSVSAVVKAVIGMKNKHVCLTGGEPLIQEDIYPLVYELLEKGYVVSIETNGGVDVHSSSTRSYVYIMDVKTPSSGGMEAKNIYANMAKLNSRDEVKFVIADIEDYIFAKDILKKYPTKAPVIFSPLFKGADSTILEDLATWLVEDKLHNVRLGVQLHKIIGIS
jgi:7-carboxy-7-deazaguanine synthase